MPAPLIQVSSHGTIRVDADALCACGAEFGERHAVLVPGLVSPPLLRVLQDELAAGPFASIDRELCIEDRLERCSLWNHLVFLANDPELFRLVEQLTGCDPIGSFMGRVYRRSGNGHFYPWHSDMAQDRLIGMSINLGPEPFQGGALRVRECTTQRVIFDRTNAVPGDAVLFRISDDLEHMVMPVEGRVSRTVLAGWFRRAPDFRDTMLKRLDLAPGVPHSQPLPLPRRLHVPDTIAFHAVDDDLLVHGLANDAFVRLDRSARRIWELVVDRQDVNATLADLSAEYDAPPDELARDTHRLLAELLALGLLEAV